MTYKLTPEVLEQFREDIRDYHLTPVAETIINEASGDSWGPLKTKNIFKLLKIIYNVFNKGEEGPKMIRSIQNLIDSYYRKPK